MSSRTFRILIFVAQALSALAVPAVLAEDKPPAASKSITREVIAVVPRSWPPQYDLDENGNPVGFAIDVMNEVARRAGISVTYRVVGTFAEVLEVMDSGTADIIPNSGITPERSERYFFTSPVQTTAISIIVRAKTTGIRDLSDLAGRHVGIVESSVGEKIVKPYGDILPTVSKDAISALFELLSGHVDALIHAPSVIMALARKAGVEDRIEAVGKPVMEIKRAIRVRKDRPELLAALDDAVKDFVGTPDYQRIYVKWYGKSAPFWSERRIAWTAGGAFAALLLVFAWWRYRLIVRVNRRIAASEEKFRDLIEGAVPGVLIHRNHRPLFANRSYARIFGYDSPEEVLRQESAFDHVAPHERERLKGYSAARLRGDKAPDVYEFQGVRKNGTLIWLENRGRVVDWEGAPAIQRTVVDITERKQLEDQLLIRTRQQAVVAELGQFALMEGDMTVFLNTAVVLVTKILGADFGKILELLPGGNELLLRAGVGWKPGLVGRATVSAGKSSQAGFTLLGRQPVVVADLRQETRFEGPPLLRDHGVVSGVSVIIGEPDHPYGVLAVHTKTQRIFSEDHALFLKTVAIMLASAISRKRTEEALRTSENRLRGAIESMQEGFALFDADDRLVVANDQYLHINLIAKEVMERGGTFEEIFRDNVERRLIARAIGREGEAIRERLEQHRNPKGSITMRWTNGKVYLIKETHTPEGGIAVTINDVSELTHAEEALRASEHRLRGAIESIQEGFVLYDADDRMVMMNEEYRRFAPRADEFLKNRARFEDVVRGHVESGLIADAVGRKEEFIRERLEQHRNPKGSIIRRHSNGKWYIIKETRTPNGGIAMTFTDITELKRADQALDEAEQHFQIVVDNLPMAVNIKDRDGRYVMVNKQFEEWHRVSASEVIGKLPEEVPDLLPTASPIQNAHHKAVVDTRTVITRPLRISRPDGEMHDREITKFPVLDAKGEVRLVGTVTTDVTERKRAEQKLAELQAELAHVSRISTMGEMAAGLAHELNQPLTAITNYAKGTLRRLHAGGGDAVDLLPIMELVAEQALRAGDIIRKIRGFMNRSEPKKTRIDLRTTIDEVMSLLAGEINMNGIEVAVGVPTSLPPVTADSIQVQQVLLNLIRNAVAAMNGDGTNHHRLEIGAKAEGAGEVEIFVKDNGPGVSPDIVGRLFEPFFTTKTDGLGMGLSISRSIVTGHRGRIWFSSQGDEGATFHFTLPTGTGGQHDAA